MNRTYRLKHWANRGKQTKILAVFKEYRLTAKRIADHQWYLFFSENGFNKNHQVKDITSALSERYKQVCQYQVVGMLESYISNRKNDFINHVYNSSLTGQAKLELLYINKYGLWFRNNVKIPVFNNNGKKIKGKHKTIDTATIKLSRKIFKHILSKHRKPTMKHINMALDQKVAIIEPKENPGAQKYDYWLKLSTLESGSPIYLPLQSNAYFENIPGKRRNFCQFNLTEAGEITVSLIKDTPPVKNYIPSTPKLGLDLGLENIFATDKGDLFGRRFYRTLLWYDKAITDLSRNRQKQALKPRSTRYARLVGKLRAYLKNELNRILNRIIKLYAPGEIIVERLNFQNPNLSRRLNRLLSRFGKGLITAKLEALHEEYGIIITYINPAYTSQTCAQCGYVDKRNRRSRAGFICKFCRSNSHADVNGARNILARSSDNETGSVYKTKQQVLHVLAKRFVSSLERTPRLNSKAKDLILSNPYFKDYWDKFKVVS
ncbi:MAG: RNA-guided endonuclease InsQ/TnpB family protein [Dethiobacteria bacterium]|jgi:putative transposase